MKTKKVTKGFRSTLLIAASLSMLAVGCSTELPVTEDMTSRLDFCVEKSDYALSRATAGLFEEPVGCDSDDSKLGVWVRKSKNPLAWLIENKAVDFAGGEWSSIWSDALDQKAEKEVFVYSPYLHDVEIVAEAFQNRATGGNIAGMYYKVSPDATDLYVGATTSISDDISIRLTPVLAKVGFTVSVNVDGTARQLTLGEAGTFDLGDGNSIIINSVTLYGNFYGEGVVNMLSCGWAVPDRADSRLCGKDYIGTGALETSRIDKFTLTSSDFVSCEDFDTTLSTRFRLNRTESDINLIPQSCADGDAVSFEVNYTLVNPSGCALTFTENSAPKELALRAGQTTLFDIAFDFSTITFGPSVVTWH